MIHTITIINHLEQSIKLDIRRPEESGFLVYSIDGLQPPEANINTSPKAAHDGSNYLSSNVELRNIVFTLFFEQNQNGESIDELRRKSYKFFPLKKNITMIFEDDKSKYTIKGFVESNNATIWGSPRTGTQISIICTNPYFEKDYGTETNFNNIIPTFTFPFSNKSTTEPTISFGYFEFNTEKYTYYDGSVETGFKVEISSRGFLGDITIYHSNTKQLLLIQDSVIETMTGAKLQDRDVLVLNTVVGQNSLVLTREGVNYNVLNAIKRPIQWLKLEPGDNLFVVTSTTGALYMDVKLLNNILLEGL